jgi:hypothetical protein
MPTPEESREQFIDSQFTEQELELLKERGLYQDYVEGSISINTIYAQMRDQGV